MLPVPFQCSSRVELPPVSKAFVWFTLMCFTFELGQARVKRESGHMQELMSQSCCGLVLATICSQPQPTQCVAMQVDTSQSSSPLPWNDPSFCSKRMDLVAEDEESRTAAMLV